MLLPGARETESHTGPACLDSSGMRGVGQDGLASAVGAAPGGHWGGGSLRPGERTPCSWENRVPVHPWGATPSPAPRAERDGQTRRGGPCPPEGTTHPSGGCGELWGAGEGPPRVRGAARRQEASRSGGGRLAGPCSNGAAAAAPAASHRPRYRPQPARRGRPAGPAPAPGPAPGSGPAPPSAMDT